MFCSSIYIYIYIYIHNMYTYIYIYIYKAMHICRHVRIYMFTQTYAHTHARM